MSIPYELIVEVIEAAAVALLCLGLIISTGRFLYGIARQRETDVFVTYRRELGRSLRLALEFLIAADIIWTVTVEMTWSSTGMLAALVLIRTFLSFALEVEVSGRWPWQEYQANLARKE